MSALQVISQCRAAGISLHARGDCLHVEAPAGTITPELRQALADHKPALLALHAIRGRLLDLAKSNGIPRSFVLSLPPEELEATADQLAACDGHLDREGNPLARTLLTFYLHALAGKSPVVYPRQQPP